MVQLPEEEPNGGGARTGLFPFAPSGRAPRCLPVRADFRGVALGGQSSELNDTSFVLKQN